MNELSKNNGVRLVGVVQEFFKFSHNAYGEDFYTASIAVERLSGKSDIIPFVVSERIINVAACYKGNTVEICGEYRSYNQPASAAAKKRLMLVVFVQSFTLWDDVVSGKDSNKVELKGFLCKPPMYRTTPLGREIADILIAVHRPNGKSDYIPCIAWGRAARWVSNAKIGAVIKVVGRIQSCEYEKSIPNESLNYEIIKMTAYEVSCVLLSEIED